MLLSLLYMGLRVILRLAPAGNGRDREVEILVLRHQVKVLKRKAGRPRLRRRDESSSRPRRGSCRRSAGLASSSHGRRFFVGTASSSDESGPTAKGEPAALGSIQRSVRSRSAWQQRTPAGATSGSRASSANSASVWGQPPSGGSCSKKDSDPRPAGLVRAGQSSSVPKPKASWRV